jgi:hypothetical protein
MERSNRRRGRRRDDALIQDGRNPEFWRNFFSRPVGPHPVLRRDARRAGEEEAEATMSTLRLVLLFVVSLALTGALTGCPGPNYAPYDNMNNNSPG